MGDKRRHWDGKGGAPSLSRSETFRGAGNEINAPLGVSRVTWDTATRTLPVASIMSH